MQPPIEAKESAAQKEAVKADAKEAEDSEETQVASTNPLDWFGYCPVNLLKDARLKFIGGELTLSSV